MDPKHSVSACTGKNMCIEKVGFFSNLRKEQLCYIVSKASHVSFKKGNILFEKKQLSDKLYIINKGSLKTYISNSDGKEQILSVLKEGDVLGILNIIKEGRYNFSCAALENSSICMLTKDNFQEIIAMYPEIQTSILEYMCDQVTHLENLIEIVTTKSANKRIAALLINAVDNFGVAKDGIIEIPNFLSRENFANFLGLARETASRKLSTLEDDGIIKLAGKKIIVLKLNELYALN